MVRRSPEPKTNNDIYPKDDYELKLYKYSRKYLAWMKNGIKWYNKGDYTCTLFTNIRVGEKTPDRI